MIRAGHRTGSGMNKSGDILEDLVRVSTLIIRRIIGCRCEIVSRPTAQSRHRISGGGFIHIQPLPRRLEIHSGLGTVINTVTTKGWVCYRIPSKGGGGQGRRSGTPGAASAPVKAETREQNRENDSGTIT